MIFLNSTVICIQYCYLEQKNSETERFVFLAIRGIEEKNAQIHSCLSVAKEKFSPLLLLECLHICMQYFTVKKKMSRQLTAQRAYCCLSEPLSPTH